MQVCFIKTTNLDGESNLKIRRPVDLKGDAPDNIAEVSVNVTFPSATLAMVTDSTCCASLDQWSSASTISHPTSALLNLPALADCTHNQEAPCVKDHSMMSVLKRFQCACTGLLNCDALAMLPSKHDALVLSRHCVPMLFWLYLFLFAWQVMSTSGQLTCEVPNANLHQFKGRFQFLSEDPGILLSADTVTHVMHRWHA